MLKSYQKPWVLAPTLSKTMGAEAPTAPILTGALHYKLCSTNLTYYCAERVTYLPR